MITVIAGVNGAGKSSIVGAYIRSQGGDYFNPDEIARQLIADDPGLSISEANSTAWEMGYKLLKRAVEDGSDYNFETTLGGDSIYRTLHEAIGKRLEVRIFYCGLKSIPLHIKRVENRVEKGGHHISEEMIRQRWTRSTYNMLGLISRCSAVKLIDNSAPKDEDEPRPVCLFSIHSRAFYTLPIDPMLDWAKPMASAAIVHAIW